MKKKIVAIALVAGMVLAGTASANWGQGGGKHHGQMQGQMQGGSMYMQLDQATQDKITQFRDDNQALRKEMMMKRAEKQALMRSANPDATAVAKVTGELFDLHTTMKTKAVAAGVDQYMGMGHGGMGGGKGGGMGSGRGNCAGGGRF